MIDIPSSKSMNGYEKETVAVPVVQMEEYNGRIITVSESDNDFYNLDVNSKNALLFRCITPKAVAHERKNAVKHKSHLYKYSLVLDNQQIYVCKKSFCALHQISRKKVDIIKSKLKTGQLAPSSDKRGRHMNRPHKIMSHQSIMQTWTEDVPSRGSADLVSSLWNFAQTCENVKTRRKLTVWSDSCSGENKNFHMICLHQLLLLKGIFEVIDHKFPEVGHTYLDSYRDFGRIEKVLRRHSTIVTPDQYRRIIKSACTIQSVVNDMEQYFRDVDSLPNKMGLVNKKKNLLNEKVPFRGGIKWIRIEEFGSYLYKESYDEYKPFKKVSLSKNNPPKNNSPPTEFEFTRIHNKTGNISEQKIQNIREQLPFISEEHRGFYENIIGEEIDTSKQQRRRAK
ncbi:LOW QUALITY PROTEIN: uncharacterized protein [Leptinotarsa decemlineata]|uniref:LOW QUALITY PROTEIN: uncharacterized protein n=1 Tax=Leptinotarsa decemlineata TaxID=7539 RepID=UPI003D308F08